MPYGRRFLHHRSIQDAHLSVVSQNIFGFTSSIRETCPVNRFFRFHLFILYDFFPQPLHDPLFQTGNVDCEIPKRSATSFCVFSLPSRFPMPNRRRMIICSRFVSLLMAFPRSAISTSSSDVWRSHRHPFPGYPKAAAHFHPSPHSAAHQWKPPSLFCCFSSDTSGSHFRYIVMHRWQA